MDEHHGREDTGREHQPPGETPTIFPYGPQGSGQTRKGYPMPPSGRSHAGFRGRWEDLRETGMDRQVEFVMALAIAFFAAAQWITSCQNNAAVTMQTGQLITAARMNASAAQEIAKASERNAVAAERFATTAGSLNQGITDASTALHIQATASQRGVHAATSQSYLDERGWIGFANPTLSVFTGKPLKAHAEAIILGKTPAVNIETISKLVSITSAMDLSQQDIVYPNSPQIVKIGTRIPGSSFPINTSGSEAVDGQEAAAIDGFGNGTVHIHFFGQTTYEDVFHVQHWTHFCYVFTKEHPDGFPCRIYNDSDADYKAK